MAQVSYTVLANGPDGVHIKYSNFYIPKDVIFTVHNNNKFISLFRPELLSLK